MTLYRRIRSVLHRPKYVLWCSRFRFRKLADEPDAWYSQEKPILWAYAGGGRLHVYGNSREAIDDSIGHGLKVLELDVALTSDGIPVLTHHFMPGGVAGQYSRVPPSLDEFMKTPLNGKYTPLSLERFFELYKSFDGHVSIDPHFMDAHWQLEALPRWIAEHATPAQRSRIIYQVFDLKSALRLSRGTWGFASLHYSMYEGVDGEASLWRIPHMLKVLTASGVRSVSMGEHEISESTRSAIRMFRDAGIHVSIAGVDSIDRCREWVGAGADIFNSRLLTPADMKGVAAS